MGSQMSEKRTISVLLLVYIYVLFINSMCIWQQLIIVNFTKILFGPLFVAFNSFTGTGDICYVPCAGNSLAPLHTLSTDKSMKPYFTDIRTMYLSSS